GSPVPSRPIQRIVLSLSSTSSIYPARFNSGVHQEWFGEIKKGQTHPLREYRWPSVAKIKKEILIERGGFKPLRVNNSIPGAELVSSDFVICRCMVWLIPAALFPCSLSESGGS